MTIVPLSIESGHVVVEARLAGRAGRFVLDTGSGAAALAPGFADGLDLAFDAAPAQALGAGGAMAPVRLARSCLELGPLRLMGMRTAVLASDPFQSTGHNIAGTLGRGVFERWTVRIDFVARRLILTEPDDFAPGNGVLVRPIDVSAGVPIVEALVEARGGETPRPLRLVLDTGTGFYPMLLGAAAAERAGLSNAGPAIDVMLGAGAAGKVHGKVRRAASLGFDGLPLPNAFLGVVEADAGFFGSGFADGTLGLGYLGRGALTLDYAGRRLAFEADTDFGRPSDYFDTCGWRIEKAPNGDWRVAWVARDGPANDAGAEIGDRIVAMGGVAAAALGREELDRMVASEGALAVTLRRRGRAIETQLMRRPLI